MPKTRICGKQCHNAKTKKCRCWCGGTFHGSEGEAARATFATSFSLSKLPTTEAAFKALTQPRLFDGLDGGVPRGSWRDRVADAVAAREVRDSERGRKRAVAQSQISSVGQDRA